MSTKEFKSCRSYKPGHWVHYGVARNDAQRELVSAEIIHLEAGRFLLRAEGKETVVYNHDTDSLIETIARLDRSHQFVISGTTRAYIGGRGMSGYKIFHLSTEPLEECVPQN